MWFDFICKQASLNESFQMQNIYILMTLISHSDMVGEYLYLESLKRFDSIFIIIFIVKIIDAVKNNKIIADPL